MKRKRFSFKGWYKGWFFRSLKELSYAVQLDKDKTPWRGAETADLTVEYVDIYGKTRKHYADFFVENKFIIEIKPTRHMRGKTVQLKADAMRAFCDKNKYIYMMISPRKIKTEDLQKLIDDKQVTFTDECNAKVKPYLKRRYSRRSVDK